MNTTPTERIFISYKRKDKERVFAIKNKIENATGEKCWIDLDGIESSEAFRKVIINAIKQCEIFLFMYSKNHTHIDTDSDWTMREIDYATRQKKRVVIVKLDNVEYFDEFDFAYGHKQYVNADDCNMMEHLFTDIRSWLQEEQKTKPQAVIEQDKKNAPSTPEKEKIKVLDKVMAATKDIDSKKVAKGAAIAAGVAAGVIIAPIGTAIVGGAVGAKKLLDKYNQKNKKA